MKDLKKGILYEIHTGGDEDNYDVGYLLTQDDSHIIFQTVNVNGFEDGLLLHRTDDIDKVQFNTKYTDGIAKMIQHHQTKLKEIKFSNANLLMEVLHYAKNNKSMVGISLKNSGVLNLLGFVETITKESITTLEIGNDGEVEGNGLAKIDDIDYIGVDMYRHQKNKILFSMNKQKGKT